MQRRSFRRDRMQTLLVIESGSEERSVNSRSPAKALGGGSQEVFVVW